MSLKDYREMPDEGLFEKIERRLLLRRIGTVAIVAAVTAVVAGVTIWIAYPRPTVVADNNIVAAIESPHEMTETMLPPVQDASSQAVGQKSDKSGGVNIPTDENRAEEDTKAPSLPTETKAPASRTVAQSPTLSTAQPIVPTTEQTPSHPGTQREATQVYTTPATETPDLVATQKDSTTKTPAAVAEAKGEQQSEQQPHYDNILWAPNVMAPASDNERNRQFKVVSTSPVSDYRIIIYNRGGRQVYSSADINAAWDATIDGEPLPQGTYVWVARFKDSGGTVRQERGTVTVIR